METSPSAPRHSRMMTIALALALFLQDPAIDENVKALSHEDESVREKAAAELRKTPLAKLDQLEKHRTDPASKSSVRLRRIMSEVLASNLGTRKPRLQIRVCATPEVMKEWIGKGVDPARAPMGCECLQVKKGVLNLGTDHEIYKREWIPLEPAIISEMDVEEALAEPSIQRGGGSWGVTCKLNEPGADTFDKLASMLFNRKPKGLVAIVLDGKILAAPVVNGERFRGRIMIGFDLSQVEAQDLVRVLNGEWLEASMRAEREKDGAAAPEKLANQIRGMKGLGNVAITPAAGNLEISGLIDIKEADLVSLWKSLREQGYRLAPKK